MEILSANGIQKTFGKNKVLKGLNFSIREFERVAIVGGNGAGKTTLLNIISGNDSKFSGVVETEIKKKEISFQFQTTNYSDEFTVFDLLFIFEKKEKISIKETKQKIIRKLESVNLINQINSKPSDLSGGQMQKLNLLLTMASEPKLVFFDEILSGLDQLSIDDIFNFNREYIKGKTTSITISHNPREVFELCDRVVFLVDGKIHKDVPISTYSSIDELEKDMKDNIIVDSTIDYDIVFKEESKFRFIENKEHVKLSMIKKSFGLNNVLTGTDYRGIDLSFQPSERVALIGKNGSGKSTLAEIIASTLKPNKGTVELNIVSNDYFVQEEKIINKIDKLDQEINKLHNEEKEYNELLKANKKKQKPNIAILNSIIKWKEAAKISESTSIKPKEISGVNESINEKVNLLYEQFILLKNEDDQNMNKRLKIVNDAKILIKEIEKSIYLESNTHHVYEINYLIDSRISLINKLKKKMDKNIKLNNKRRANNIGIQFQKQFYPELLNLRDVVIFSLKSNGIEYDEKYVEDILEVVGLKKHMYNTTYEISGGQRQKLNIILTLIKQPSFIIFDELTTGLDVLARERLSNLILMYAKKTKATLLTITHSKEDIVNLAERVIVLKDGAIVDDIKYDKSINVDNLLRDI